MRALIVFAVALRFLTASVQAEDALRLVATIALPGVSGRFDHFAIDAEGQRLFVAALGNNSVEVIDVLNNKRVTSISGLQKPTGIAFIPRANQIGVAAGGEGVFKVFSGADYKAVTTIESLDDADNVRLNKTKDTVFVGYGDGALAVIDVKTWKKTGDIKIGGHPESFQVEEQGNRIFINIPGVKEIAVADSSVGRAVRNFRMTKFQSNFPMALDEAGKRIFVGCRQPPRLVILESANGKELADVEISSDTDDLFYDVKRERLYVSCGEGAIDVISVVSRQPAKRLQKIQTRAGARTSFYSRDLDRFFLAIPKRGSDPAEIRIYSPSLFQQEETGQRKNDSKQP